MAKKTKKTNENKKETVKSTTSKVGNGKITKIVSTRVLG